MAQAKMLEALSQSPVINEAAKTLADVRAQVIEALNRAQASELGNVFDGLLGAIKIGDSEMLMGLGAFVATAIPARMWTKEANANDGKVSANEMIGIGSRAVMMAAGTVMFEGAMVQDSATALAAAGLLGVELKLGYDIIKTIRSGELNIARDGNLTKKDYWVKMLKTAGKVLGALVVIPKLNLLLFVANPTATVAGEVGAGLVMAANYDQMKKLLNG